MQPLLRLSFFGLLLVFVAPAPAQPATLEPGPLSERRVAYVIDAVLDPDARLVRATEQVTWRNPDRVPVDELQFHLYLNAFRDEHSTFMRESGGAHRGFSAMDAADPWGRLEITEITATALNGRPVRIDLTDRLRFIRPGDGNPHDRTVAAVSLPEGVDPGAAITLDVAFEAHLPRIFARTGWARKADGTLFFMVAQWFPKLGVYEVPGQRYVPADAPRGAWSTHTFHANSEFYADFGTYDVTLSVPEGYVVGATGVRVAETTRDGRHTLTYRAEDVHDFAWTASPAFLEYEDAWRDVNLRLLLQPEHEAQAQRHFDAAKTALRYLDEWIGPYPYTTLTLVDGLGGSNGMEYPTLITCGTVYRLPSWLRILELVTIHEVAHQYFYGLLASNEAEEAWLDEGFASYLEMRIMDAAYGPGSVLDVPGFRISDGALQRVQYTENDPTRGAVFARSWDYAFRSDYAKVSYAKSATLLKTLENHLGWPVMQQILRTYYQRWRFRHPTTRDFIAVAEEVSGHDLDWFFDQFVYGTVAVDYAVDAIHSRPIRLSVGEAPARYRSTVVVHRKQAGRFPQTLRVRFAGGAVEERAWDGAAEWERFTFTSEAPLEEAFLDPDNRVWLDINRLNNRRVATPDFVLARKEQLSVTTWLQQLFYLVAGVF